MFCPKRVDRVPSSYFLSSPGVDVDGRRISSKREKGVLTCKSDCGWEEGKGLWNWMEMSPSPPRISLQKMIDCFLSTDVWSTLCRRRRHWELGTFGVASGITSNPIEKNRKHVQERRAPDGPCAHCPSRGSECNHDNGIDDGDTCSLESNSTRGVKPRNPRGQSLLSPSSLGTEMRPPGQHVGWRSGCSESGVSKRLRAGGVFLGCH